DGGKTWTYGTLNPGDHDIDLGGTIMTIPQGVRVPAFDPDNTAASQLVVRPTAVYQGADSSAVPQIIFKTPPPYGVTASTTGVFTTDIQVRFDTEVLNWGTPGEAFAYSYSTDGGLTWTQRQGNTDDPRLVVPGGFVTIGGSGFPLKAGAELTVKPLRADLPMQVEFDYLSLANNVGKDVFGGVYTTIDEYGRKVQMTAFDGAGMNLFETVGKLIGALETNNQDGIQQALDNLTAADKHITAYAARIGGRRNALAVASEALVTTRDTQQEAMGHIEDIDLTTLLVKLTQQQLAYSTVLKSSSMIMQLNLTHYI
ncbi:MAG: flagellar hook-associated protein 3, partial [Deltaproteobacteria bacterium]|nr:flagellar hook-associated protein 3 [Deltaproteobacteria bacterium]